MGKVIGIGGIFIKSENPEKLKTWYKDHLGIESIFRWQRVGDYIPSYTLWNAFSANSKVFDGIKNDYLFTYIVDDLPSILDHFKKVDIKVLTLEKDVSIEFAYVDDGDGNKLILWQPGTNDPGIPSIESEKVTGLGGVFQKSPDIKKLNDWYATNLGFEVTEWGCSFEWVDPKNTVSKGLAQTAWSIFKSDSDYFNPSKKQFMINYRVKNLTELLKNLKDEGVEMAGEMQEFSYGKFGWVMDAEGNKIELWESIE